MSVYRVWNKGETDHAWVLADSIEEAIETLEPLGLLEPPLSAALDNKKFDIPKGVVLGMNGQITRILKG